MLLVAHVLIKKISKWLIKVFPFVYAQILQGDFSVDSYAHHLLDKYYDGVGPKRLKLAIRFLLGPDGRLMTVLHGLWAEPRKVLSISQLKQDKFKLLGEMQKFDDVWLCCLYHCPLLLFQYLILC